MKLLTSSGIREWDQYTIQQRSIKSIELMDHAAGVFCDWLMSTGPDREKRLIVLAGPSNNGGDGLAVSRLIGHKFRQCIVFRIFQDESSCSNDHLGQLELLNSNDHCAELHEIHPGESFPDIHQDDIVIDGIFGSGLSRPMEGWWAALIEHINVIGAQVFAIDIPSGLPADGPALGPVLKAYKTLSFEIPKLSFFMPENDDYPGKWEARSIGLSPDFPSLDHGPFRLIDREEVQKVIRPRKHFSHKGSYGHLLLICGSSGKMGAAILAARASLRSGAGLVTVCIPSRGEVIMQTAVPEAMVIVDPHDYHWSTPIKDLKFTVMGIGCGIGTPELTQKALLKQIEETNSPIVLDADALNILSQTVTPLEKLPRGSVITPHPGEFKRLFGEFENSLKRWDHMIELSCNTGITIVLKGANTAISTPGGKLWINSSGNPGMATAGSGDVLTGLITGLMAQGYTGEESAKLGVYWHGLAGDLAAGELGYEALTASDLIDHLGMAFVHIRKRVFS